MFPITATVRSLWAERCPWCWLSFHQFCSWLQGRHWSAFEPRPKMILYESRGTPWTQQTFLYSPAPNVPFHVISPTLKPRWWDQMCHNDTSAHMLRIQTKRTVVISPTGTDGHWASSAGHQWVIAAVQPQLSVSHFRVVHLKLPLHKKTAFSGYSNRVCSRWRVLPPGRSARSLEIHLPSDQSRCWCESAERRQWACVETDHNRVNSGWHMTPVSWSIKIY